MSGFGLGPRIAARGPRRYACDFAGSERGSLTIFSIFVIIAMLILGGLAVDFMRQEAARAKLQSTMDRAVLAAADMDQSMDPQAVFQDYMARGGFGPGVARMRIEKGLTANKVSAVGGTQLESYFLKFVGITRLDVPAASAAEESINNVEISLVLDVSTSMTERSRSGRQKIDDLKVAAQEFVDTVFDQAAGQKTTVSIVPYSTQVNAGASLLSHLNVSAEHTYSNCVDFAEADYGVTAISPSTALQRTGHFDPLTRSNGRAGLNQRVSQIVCRTDAAVEAMPISGNRDALKAKIRGLVANGYTSIELGVKWGAALLDPAFRPVITDLVAEDKVATKFKGRPHDYNSAETLKVIVAMTDGINTEQWYLKPGFRSGPSQVWLDQATGKLSYLVPGIGGQVSKYWIPTNGSNGLLELLPAGGKDAVNLSFPQLWATMNVDYYSHQIAAANNLPGNRNTAADRISATVYGGIDNPAKNIRTDLICDAAKAAGIRIYTVGFEVTDASAMVLSECATNPSNFFRVDGTDIRDAFRAIANDIGKLRLTQ